MFDDELSEDFYDSLRLLEQRSGINILSNKELHDWRVDANGDPIAALYIGTTHDKFSFDVIVDPDHQNQGIGTSLVREALELYYDSYEDLGLDIEIDVVNPQMASILEKEGFQVQENLGEHQVMRRASDEFDYQNDINELWAEKLQEAQDRQQIDFDTENNESHGETLKVQFDDYEFVAEMYSAGGDWENPVLYFRVQITEGFEYSLGDSVLSRGDKFVWIPGKTEGNTSLVTDGEASHAWTEDDGDEGIDEQDNDENLAKQSLEKFLEGQSGSREARLELDTYQGGLPYEEYMSGNQPITLPDEEVGPHPKWMNPFHGDENLISGSRTDRLTNILDETP